MDDLNNQTPRGTESRDGRIAVCSPTPTSRRIVVVLGMHRSGTSLLTSLLTVLGVKLGDNLLVGDANNEAGYWEQQEIYQTQDELLKCLQRHWSGPSGSASLPDNWWQLAEIAPYKQKLKQILCAEINAAADATWAFKDPRTSRLLPMWEEIFAELNLKPIYLLAIREPANVIESVSNRDEIPANRAELLWLLHNLDAIRDAGSDLRLVVDYDRWFTHPREQAQAVACAIGVEWPADETAVLASMHAKIRPDLRHYRAPRPVELPFTTELHRLLQQAAVTGQVPDGLAALDAQVRQALALAQPWMDSVLELTKPALKPEFRLIDHFNPSQLEPLGATGQAAIWNVIEEDAMIPCIFLHPPGRLRFRVPDGRHAHLSFAVSLHPDAWGKPHATGCEFIVTANGTIRFSLTLDPSKIPAHRRWHECVLELPESPNGFHEVILETQSLSRTANHCWAMWRAPKLTWESIPRRTAAPDPAGESIDYSRLVGEVLNRQFAENAPGNHLS